MGAPVVVGTTSQTTTSRMLAVLSYTSMTGRDVATVLARLRQMGRHSVLKEKIVSDELRFVRPLPPSASNLHPAHPASNDA